MLANRALIKTIAWMSAAVFAASLIWWGVPKFFGVNSDPRSELHLREIAAQINRSVPVMIDKESELLPAEGHEGMLIYNYRLVSYSASQLDHEKFAAGARQKVTQGACSRPETRDEFLKHGVTLRYSYFDKDKTHIATIDVTPADCEKIPPLCDDCYRILKDTFGCASKSSFDRVIAFIAQGDEEAAARGIANWCEMLNWGDVVYRDYSGEDKIPPGVVKIRRKGSTRSLWVMSEAVGK